jgi:hypothetical protein
MCWCQFYVNGGDDMVEYLGRMVPEAGFRAFVYDVKDGRKLVNSWKEFEAAMATGIWFASREDAAKSVPTKQINKDFGKKGRD